MRTLKVGHPFTQGTADSNEVWVDARVTGGNRVLGRSGGLGAHNEVDPWSHFVNVYMLDRDGNRVDRRNPQDIFTPLYNHQIPPGAGQVVHYSFTVPETQDQPLTFEVKLQYRKFDPLYLNRSPMICPSPRSRRTGLHSQLTAEGNPTSKIQNPKSRTGNAGTITASGCSWKATGEVKKAN